jgi:hypothetical protein
MLEKVITKRDCYEKRKASKQICLLRFLNLFLKSNKGVRMDKGFHRQKSKVSCP